MLACRSLILLQLLVLGISGPTFAAERPALSAAERKKLETQWAAQRVAIKTADVRFRYFIAVRAGLKELSVKQFDALLSKSGIDSDPQEMEDFALSLVKPKVEFPAKWTEGRIQLDGRNRREGLFQHVRVVDGTTDVGVSEGGTTRQVNLSPVGKSRRHMTHVNEIRSPPSPELSKTKFVKRRGKQIELQLRGNGSRWDVTVDQDTGGILSDILTRKGVVVSKRIQRNFKTDAGGVTWPRLSMTCKFRKGVLFMVRIFLVKECDFNQQVPATAFQVPINKGDVVVDSRPGKRRISTAIEFVNDARNYPN